jgi:hypothetical protein
MAADPSLHSWPKYLALTLHSLFAKLNFILQFLYYELIRLIKACFAMFSKIAELAWVTQVQFSPSSPIFYNSGALHVKIVLTHQDLGDRLAGFWTVLANATKLKMCDTMNN